MGCVKSCVIFRGLLTRRIHFGAGPALWLEAGNWYQHHPHARWSSRWAKMLMLVLSRCYAHALAAHIREEMML